MTGSSADTTLSIVVPVYNAAGSLEALAERVASALGDRQYELVLVNDGSPDESWELIEALVGYPPRCRHWCVIGRLSENRRPRNGYSRRLADVAQLVEHFTRNEGVPGSSPGVGLVNQAKSGTPEAPCRGLEPPPER
jgi:glycosyltransferase involved in cell wall biosynthesis